MFEIKAIQAGHGDALFISYGELTAPLHILVDGGTADTKNNLMKVLVEARRSEKLRLEALVVTHYDLDHINGIIELLKEKPSWLEIGDVWFNGKKHARPKDTLGKIEGDELTELINGKFPWNLAFDGKRICATGRNQSIDLAGMKIWVLSPDETRLASLGVEWSDSIPSAEPSEEVETDTLGRKDVWPLMAYSKFVPQKFKADNSIANGSSIALMLEYNFRRALLTGDAFAAVVRESLTECFKSFPVEVHLLKVSHHGSKANTDSNLLKAIKCDRFLFSTDGAIHRHPDQSLIGQIIESRARAEIIFNYKQQQTLGWLSPPDDWPDYKPIFPVDGEAFVSITV